MGEWMSAVISFRFLILIRADQEEPKSVALSLNIYHHRCVSCMCLFSVCGCWHAVYVCIFSVCVFARLA